MKNIFIVLVCLFVSFQISAQDRQKDTHEHGAANLMLVIEGDQLQIGIEVPSESLIGFEYFPKSQSDRKNFNEAIKILSDPSKIFSTPDDAECLLVGLNVSQTLFSSKDEHGHDEHDEHGLNERDFGIVYLVKTTIMSMAMRKKTNMVMTSMMNMAMRIQKKEEFTLNSGQTIPGSVFIQMR